MDDPTIDITTTPVNKVDGIQIMGAVEDYDIKKVGTRAGGEDDSHISEMTMFIFDAENKLVQGWKTRTVEEYDTVTGLPSKVTFAEADKCSSAINIHKDNPTFVIDTKNGLLTSLDDDSPSVIFYDNLGDTNDLTKCKIYIVANAWHALEDKLDDIEDLADLEAVTLDIDATLAMPKDEEGKYIGFPMIGTHLGYANEGVETFDLRRVGNNSGAVAKIPLKKVYAKVNFTMQINAIQTVVNQIPTFEIEKVEVFNVPNKARLGRELDKNGKPVYKANRDDDYIKELADGTITAENISDYYQFTESPFVITDFSRKKISHTPAQKPSDDYLIEFGFYMPEHKVTPNADRTTYTGYPENIPDDLKQYYKPCLVGATRNEDGTTSLAQIATYVRIHGTYTDHNAEIKTVRYDIYLGQDNTDSFTIKRNQFINNKLVITGLTNYYDAYGDDAPQNISIDHRVDVDDKGYILSMERTAILDAHFEVRPLDIQLSKGGSMTITIPESYRSWVAMESDSRARETDDQNTYVNTEDDRKGVRKYFTDGLVSTLNTANSGTITIKQEGDVYIYRVWFYIDENPNVYDELLADGTIKSSPSDGYTVNGSAGTTDDDMYRVCPVQFTYSNTTTDENDNSIPVSKTTIVNFQQWNLWRVWNTSKTRYYDIEHEEEYLNNYASDAQYGSAKNGMPYGLEGIQLSERVLAYWLEKVSHQTGGGSIINSIINWIVSGLDNLLNISNSSKSIFSQSGKEPYYDFYLTRDAFPVDKLESTVDKTQYARDYQGRAFNEEIITTLLTTYKNDNRVVLNGVHLNNTDLKSAIAYVYNKNKRDSNGNVCIVNDNGTVDTNNLKWYLPAIDEIEDIALGAYDEFDKVFQNKKYWSCQPAYELNKIIIEPSSSSIEYYKYNTMEGDFFNDNTSRARATSVYTNGTVYSNIESGLPNNLSSGKLTSRVNVKVDIGWTDVKVTQNGDPITQWQPSNVDYSDPIFANPNGAYRGNTPRSESCRIRAVYRSGNVK